MINKEPIIYLLFFLAFLSASSCSLPNGISIGPVDDDGQESYTITLNDVALKFNLSKKLDASAINGDFGEIVAHHNAKDLNWYTYSGTIDNLGSILFAVDNYDESHKASINVTAEDLFMGKIKHECKEEDVVANTVHGIPKVKDLYMIAIEIKSIKTTSHGVQIVWTKSALKENWPISEYISDGTITCDVPSIIKVGTNNNGNIAARNGYVILNTSDDSTFEYHEYKEDDDQLISPDLQKPILINGEISNDLVWSVPVILKEI